MDGQEGRRMQVLGGKVGHELTSSHQSNLSSEKLGHSVKHTSVIQLALVGLQVLGYSGSHSLQQRISRCMPHAALAAALALLNHALLHEKVGSDPTWGGTFFESSAARRLPCR